MLELIVQLAVNKAIKVKLSVGGWGIFLLRFNFQCTGEWRENFKFCRSREGVRQIPDSYFDLHDRWVSDFGLCPTAGGNYRLRRRHD